MKSVKSELRCIDFDDRLRLRTRQRVGLPFQALFLPLCHWRDWQLCTRVIWHLHRNPKRYQGTMKKIEHCCQLLASTTNAQKLKHYFWTIKHCRKMCTGHYPPVFSFTLNPQVFHMKTFRHFAFLNFILYCSVCLVPYYRWLQF